MEYIIILRNANRELADIGNKLLFFEISQKSGIIPFGLSIKVPKFGGDDQKL